MKYLTFLDYTTLESTGKNIELKLLEKEKEIGYLRERDTNNATAISELRTQVEILMAAYVKSIDNSARQNVARQLIEKGSYKA